MSSIRPAICLNVLCRFWFEDSVWNGVAQDLPVAVFGDTFEQAKANLLDAVICHLQAASEVGKLDQTISALQQKEHDLLPIDEIPPNAALVKIPVVMNGSEILPVAP